MTQVSAVTLHANRLRSLIMESGILQCNLLYFGREQHQLILLYGYGQSLEVNKQALAYDDIDCYCRKRVLLAESVYSTAMDRMHTIACFATRCNG